MDDVRRSAIKFILFVVSFFVGLFLKKVPSIEITRTAINLLLLGFSTVLVIRMLRLIRSSSLKVRYYQASEERDLVGIYQVCRDTVAQARDSIVAATTYLHHDDHVDSSVANEERRFFESVLSHVRDSPNVKYERTIQPRARDYNVNLKSHLRSMIGENRCKVFYSKFCVRPTTFLLVDKRYLLWQLDRAKESDPSGRAFHAILRINDPHEVITRHFRNYVDSLTRDPVPESGLDACLVRRAEVRGPALARPLPLAARIRARVRVFFASPKNRRRLLWLMDLPLVLTAYLIAAAIKSYPAIQTSVHEWVFLAYGFSLPTVWGVFLRLERLSSMRVEYFDEASLGPSPLVDIWEQSIVDAKSSIVAVSSYVPHKRKGMEDTERESRYYVRLLDHVKTHANLAYTRIVQNGPVPDEMLQTHINEMKALGRGNVKVEVAQPPLRPTTFAVVDDEVLLWQLDQASPDDIGVLQVHGILRIRDPRGHIIRYFRDAIRQMLDIAGTRSMPDGEGPVGAGKTAPEATTKVVEGLRSRPSSATQEQPMGPESRAVQQEEK